METTEEIIREKKRKRVHNFLVRWILTAILISLIVLNVTFIVIAINIANMNTAVEKIDFFDNFMPFKKR